MTFLVDTSVLVRLANTADALYPLATTAIVELHRRGEILLIAAQNLIEFRSAATRPKPANGLGLSVTESEAKAAEFEAEFGLVPETPAIFPAWKALVSVASVVGKRVHDARLVAVCHVHGVTHLLTFNASHFSGLAPIAPGVIVVEPANV